VRDPAEAEAALIQAAAPVAVPPLAPGPPLFRPARASGRDLAERLQPSRHGRSTPRPRSGRPPARGRLPAAPGRPLRSRRPGLLGRRRPQELDPDLLAVDRTSSTALRTDEGRLCTLHDTQRRLAVEAILAAHDRSPLFAASSGASGTRGCSTSCRSGSSRPRRHPRSSRGPPSSTSSSSTRPPSAPSRTGSPS